MHRLRNVLAKLPKRPMLHSRVRAAYWAALDRALNPEEAEHGLRVLVGELAGDFPSAAACLADDLPALTVHLRYPLRLRRRLRSTNLLERSLEEVRISNQTLSEWLREDRSVADPLSVDERAEFVELRRRVRVLSLPTSSHNTIVRAQSPSLSDGHRRRNRGQRHLRWTIWLDGFGLTYDMSYR